jgi:hypothetical protein
MSKDTDGPAFPQNTQVVLNGGQVLHEGFMGGMTLRDYFAAKAMQIVLYQCDCFPDQDWRDGVAMDAYKMADAMLKARKT